MRKYYRALGVDPAFRANGFCVCIISDTLDEVEFVNYKEGFLGFFYDIKTTFLADSKSVIAIENSNLQNTNFDTTGNKNVIARKGRNVGANQAVSQLTVDTCKKYTSAKVLDLSPKRKGNKWNQEQFKAVLKLEGHKVVQSKKGNNQDERDAYKLALIALKELKRLNNLK
jgi:hypothetical protein